MIVNILGYEVEINTENEIAVARNIERIKSDIDSGLKENVIIEKDAVYIWFIKVNETVEYENLTAELREKLNPRCRVNISLQDLNKIIERGFTIMTLNPDFKNIGA